MPWQYSVSHQPGSVDAFDFRGEALSLNSAFRPAVEYLNQTPFPGLGKAAIPGMQITYPTFFADRKGDLWVTYRFALKPNRDWSQRTYGCGIARYDTAPPVGGRLSAGRSRSVLKMRPSTVRAAAAPATPPHSAPVLAGGPTTSGSGSITPTRCMSSGAGRTTSAVRTNTSGANSMPMPDPRTWPGHLRIRMGNPISYLSTFKAANSFRLTPTTTEAHR